MKLVRETPCGPSEIPSGEAGDVVGTNLITPVLSVPLSPVRQAGAKRRLSYEKILSYVNQHGYAAQMPTREVYIKGPGMIFRGNPKKYLTEIQMLIDG